MLRYGAVLLALVVASACGGDDDDDDLIDAAAVDTDGDGVPDGVDNCPGVMNEDQLDQDTDDAGDACDCSNDNERIDVANADFDDNKRDANGRGCEDDEILTGVVEGRNSVDDYIDTLGYQCTQRCDPFTTTEEFGEDDYDARGPDVNCPTGQVVVGIAYKDVAGETPPNDRIHTLTLLCAPFEGPDTNPTMVENTALDGNPGTLITLQCPEGSTANGVVDADSPDASNNNDALEGVSIRCRAGRW